MNPGFRIKRAESRVHLVVSATLIGGPRKMGAEEGLTENVSSRGVRVILSNYWPLNAVLLLSLPAGRFTAPARVAYCDAMGDKYFVIGLEFVGYGKPLDVNALLWQPVFSDMPTRA